MLSPTIVSDDDRDEQGDHSNISSNDDFDKYFEQSLMEPQIKHQLRRFTRKHLPFQRYHLHKYVLLMRVRARMLLRCSMSK